jgi:hypothetical protein
MDGIKKVILIIADISGYTNFMLSNVQALEHGQEVISELLKTIIEQVQIPLEVSKLEGDAVFLYAAKENSSNWNEVRSRIAEKLFGFFSVFQQRISQLVNTTCTCGACVNIEKLKLKLIVHSGEALFYQLGRFLELAGIDVIILHRLLKNSVKRNEYILFTDAARHDLNLPQETPLQPGDEEYEIIGKIQTWTYLPEL